MKSPKTLKARLIKELKGLQRLAVLAVGSELRADDAAGLLTAAHLRSLLKKKSVGIKVKIFFGETAPENLTGEIKKFRPTHLVVLDAMTFDKKPGQIYLMDAKAIEGVSFSTHKIPVKITLDYLKIYFPCAMILLGIEPKSLAVLGEVTREVESASKKLAQWLFEVIKYA